MEFGMIGLGRMGTNMVRRLMRAGHQCIVYDIHQEAVQALAREGAIGTNTLEDFAKKLQLPRTVWMMVPRGDDTFADRLLSALRFQFGGHEE